MANVRYSVSLIPIIYAISSPLVNHLEVKFFVYVRVYGDGSYLLMNEESFLKCLQDVKVTMPNSCENCLGLSKRESQCLKLMSQGQGL